MVSVAHWPNLGHAKNRNAPGNMPNPTPPLPGRRLEDGAASLPTVVVDRHGFGTTCYLCEFTRDAARISHQREHHRLHARRNVRLCVFLLSRHFGRLRLCLTKAETRE